MRYTKDQWVRKWNEQPKFNGEVNNTLALLREYCSIGAGVIGRIKGVFSSNDTRYSKAVQTLLDSYTEQANPKIKSKEPLYLDDILEHLKSIFQELNWPLPSDDSTDDLKAILDVIAEKRVTKEGHSTEQYFNEILSDDNTKNYYEAMNSEFWGAGAYIRELVIRHHDTPIPGFAVTTPANPPKPF